MFRGNLQLLECARVKILVDPAGPGVDHNPDDNADDSRAPSYGYDTTLRSLNSLFTDFARSWQCGGQGFESP